MAEQQQDTTRDEEDFDAAFDEFAESDAPEETEAAEPVGEEEGDVQDAAEPDSADSEAEGGQAQEDPIAAAKREAEEWKHRYNSDLGRQAALQRKIDEQQQELARYREIAQRAQQNQQAAGQKAPQKDNNPDGSGMSDAEWAALEQDFPEIAKAMESRLKQIDAKYAQRLQQYEQPIMQMRQQQQAALRQQREAYVQSQYQALEQEHPDYREVAGTQEFVDWLKQQPRQVQDITNSWDARETAYLLRLYKQDRGIGQQQTSDIQARRQRQLQQARSVPGRAGRSSGSQPPADDFDAAFDFFASQA